MKNKLNKIFFEIIIILFFLTKISFSEIPIYELFGTKIIFDSEKKIIFAEGNASATEKSGRKILSDKIIYDKNKSIIYTFSKSTYIDMTGNKLIAEQFIYDLNLKIIKAKNAVQYIDKNGNKFNFSELEYSEISEKGIGKNFNGTLLDKSNYEGEIAEFDNKQKLLIIGEKKKQDLFEKIFSFLNKKNNFYTPCEKKNKSPSKKDNCPDWSINTEQTVHDRENQMIKHYGAVVKIKNIPVFYTPYFSHPDPSVKRKSGLLPPSLKKFTNLGQTIKIPYFHAINDSKDITFTPIYYLDENPIFLTEYRQQNKNSKFYIDTSYNQGYKKLNKVDSNGNEINRTNGSRNHLFFNFLGNYNDLIFNQNDLEINLQRISQKNYLNVNEINTNNVKQDITNLNNNIILNSYEKNKKLTIRGEIFENLNIDNKNEKYQYIFPSIELNNFFNKFNQNINIANKLVAQNLGGDSNKIYQTNLIESSTQPWQFLFLNNVSNIFKTSINNVNYYNDKILYEKNNFNSDLYLTAAMENQLPLIKFDKKKTEILTPKIFTKYTTGSMTNASNENKIINTSDIFSMNRMSNNTNPETGASLGYGIDYEKKIKNNDNNIKTKNTFFIGQVLRPNKLNEMPQNSTLSNTRSAFVGKVTLDHMMFDDTTETNKDKLKINYDYIISNDLNKVLKNSLGAEINFKNNLLNIDYLKTHQISNDHFIDFKYTKIIDNEFSYSFGGKKNIKSNFTENNFISGNYETDCIKISLNLSKTFFENEELKPSNNLTLSIIFKPFGSPISPNLSNFIN